MAYIRRFCLGLFILAASASAAAAHPHVWIFLQSQPVLNAEGNLVAVRQVWQFDEIYAQTAVEGLDTDGDGTYSDAELAPLATETITSLRELDYFLVVRQNGQKIPVATVTRGVETFKDNILFLTLEVPLSAPVDPRKGEIEIKVYDPEYFIAFDYGENASFTLEGQLPAGCKADLQRLPSDEELDKSRQFLADKGTDWKPDVPVDFGSMFAPPLVLSCSKP